MYSPNSARPLWALVYHLERQAADNWRLGCAKNDTILDALALHAETLVTRVERQRGGNVLVTVSVNTKRPNWSQDYFFRLRKAGNGGYMIIEQDSPIE